jgi:ADP-heptose:LPS heptosyltransferase
LAQLPNVKLFSLQKDLRVRHWPNVGDVDLMEGVDFPFVDLAEHLTDWQATAHVIGSLDAVVTVDTAVAHLAGAMGKRVVVLLPYVPDWRWGLEGEKTCWYESMRLARQPELDDWGGAMERATQLLFAEDR